jgi:hypothetical protein
VACLVAGFGLVLAAQLLPWARINTGELVIDARNSLGADQLTLGQLATLQVTGYGLGWLLVFGGAAVLVVLPPSARRIGTAAALGLIAGQLVSVIGLVASVKSGGDFVRLDPAFSKAVSLGEGAYAGLAAIVLVTVAVLLANRRPRRSRATGAGPADGYQEIEDEPLGRGPIDLTVTPVSPFNAGR